MPRQRSVVANAGVYSVHTDGSITPHGGLSLLTGLPAPSAPPPVDPSLSSVPPPMDPAEAEMILKSHHVPLHYQGLSHPPPSESAASHSINSNSSSSSSAPPPYSVPSPHSGHSVPPVHPLSNFSSLHDSLTPSQSRAHVLESLHHLYEPHHTSTFKPVPPYNPQHFQCQEFIHQHNNQIHHKHQFHGVPPHPASIQHSKSMSSIPSHDHSNSHSHPDQPTEQTPLINHSDPSVCSLPSSSLSSSDSPAVHFSSVPTPSFTVHIPLHCPFDHRNHEYYAEYPWWGLLCGVACFPIGLICCMGSRKYICLKCGVRLPQ
jgi:hypothetical protein